MYLFGLLSNFCIRFIILLVGLCVGQLFYLSPSKSEGPRENMSLKFHTK